ncbi:hypothetical protein [Rhodoglobus sp.]
MVPVALPLVALTAASELARGTTIAVVALLVLVLGLGIGAFIVLFRRGGDRGIRGSTSQSELDARAAALLVTLDDRVRDAENEVGFAIAQFGVADTHEFGTALTEARLTLTEAFRLGQQRDTAAKDAEQLRRRNTLQMIALCDRALTSLDRFENAFAQRRRTEVDAGHTAQELRAQLRALRDRLSHDQQKLTEAAEHYVAAVLAAPQEQLARADALLTHAERELEEVSAEISPTGVNAVADLLQAVAAGLHRAGQHLTASEFSLNELGAADAVVKQLRETNSNDLSEARAARELAPDPDSGAIILAAIAVVERSLAVTADEHGVACDPFRQLAVLSDDAEQLDAALATARNQQQRLDHARAAYQGTLVAAKSQISVVRDLIGRGGASASARTRLAEAERQLMIAEAETDPVEALDAIRRSVTHARDADALARY